MRPPEIRDLIERLAASPITELEIEEDGWRIRIARADAEPPPAASARSAIRPECLDRGDGMAATRDIERGHAVTSPGFGVFSRGPSPDAPAYVCVGDDVRRGQQVGVLEAMKVFSPVESPLDGRITAILVDDGAEVWAGQALFEILAS